MKSAPAIFKFQIQLHIFANKILFEDMPEIFDEHVHLRPHDLPPPSHELAPFERQAEELGIRIGLREHAPLPRALQLGPNRDYYFAMNPDEIEPFLQQLHGKSVPLGLEVDFFPEFFEEIRTATTAILQRARELHIPIAGLHGSVHLLPGDFDDIPQRPAGLGWVMWDDREENFRKLLDTRGLEGVIEDYHRLLVQMIQTGFFQTVSHIELLRKFDRPDARGRSYYFGERLGLFDDAVLSILDTAAEHGVAVEINTQGCDRPLGRPFLSLRALKHCAQKAIPVAFGSDAHRPEEIGRHFEIAAKLCAEAGIKRLVYFRDLQPHFWQQY